MITSRSACEELDRSDSIAFARDRFALPEGVIYLDGNSLGPLPKETAGRLARTIEQEWGAGLIRSWNSADWINLPRRVGGRIAGLLGAGADEVIAADSTSVNLFKLVSATLAAVSRNSPSRRVLLSEQGNFPTDLYVAQGVVRATGGQFEIKLVGAGEVEAALAPDVALAVITQVDYRTGRMHDMAELNAVARRHGVVILWDLSHSAGAVPVELGRSGAQLAVGCGYKYFNGGPGAPAYLYVGKNLQQQLESPLAGWFGHAVPFDFAATYTPAPGIDRFQCGTPSILAMQALETGLQTFDGVAFADIRHKSLALSDLFWSLMDDHCGEFGFECIAPRAHERRGSHLSFSHPQAYPIMQSLIDRGVIGDFRQPDLIRFGFTPLYLRFADIWDAVMILRDVMLTESWKSARFQQRNAVT